MRHTWIGVATLVALSVALPTHAATPAGSWTNGGTIGADTGALYATVGFPSLDIGYLRGVSDALDVGGRFSFPYGGDGATDQTWLGLELAGEVKLKLDLGLPFVLLVRALPGVTLFFPPGFSIFFLRVPLEAALGVPVTPNLLAHVSIKAPLAFGYRSGLGVSFPEIHLPLLFGGGVELKIDPALSVTGQLHMGPGFWIFPGGDNQTHFTLGALVGVTYRLPS
ncbi:MAG TPA: hypothetical protein VIG99_14390 [Myxococcaceae bacterium]